MATTNVALDKSVGLALDDDYGTIVLRVVVLQKLTNIAGAEPSGAPEDAEPDELLPEPDKRPTSSYLESPKRGRLCCVFLVNGQRQHAWDNQFIIRDLELKYLRNRTLVIVDVDGLKPEAIAHLMQGSRHGFYEGQVYHALRARVIATLKGDPDLQRLEAEAESEVSSLESGDEAVKAALDQLIEEHHELGDRSAHGHMQGGDESRENVTNGRLNQTTAVVEESDIEEAAPATEPLLVMRPDITTIRLKPNEPRRVAFRTRPGEGWAALRRLALSVEPSVSELRVERSLQADCAVVDMEFEAPSDFDADNYPIEATLCAVATFDGHEEPRVSEHRVVIMPARQTTPPPPAELLDDPTFVKVTSRQPIKIVVGGPDVHVKLKWDGKDYLVGGESPRWTFSAICLTGQSFTGLTFTRASEGRCELLLRVPDGLGPGEHVEFRIDVVGPAGKVLSTNFEGVAVEPSAPRKVNEQIPGGSQRRPPYRLVYVKEDDWGNDTCWGATTWTEDDPGCFQEPTGSTPATLLINQDMSMLKNYKESLISRRLAEQTIQERVTRYTSHVAFHLWQMLLSAQKGIETGGEDDAPRGHSEDEMREEIKRVAYTLIRLMQVSR